jgi:hypothetical protein
MNYWNRAFAIVAALGFATVFCTTAALAQPDAGAKARGEFNFYGRSAGRSMRGARETSQAYREYAKTAPPQQISPDLAKVASESVGDDLTKTQKHLEWMRTQAKATSDKETLASLDSIDKHLAEAKKHHGGLCEHCTKDSVEAKGSMECCEKIDASLATALAEHDKLMKRLQGDKAHPDATQAEGDSALSQEIAEQMATLSPADRAIAQRQRMCPVSDEPLGSMGVPLKVIVEGRDVFICCKGCEKELLQNPATYLAKLPKE